ncbi:ABC transporter permease [Streptomyces sp. NPDC055105]|uniref:ABC transporter permease n=1 Tax=Streptomyces sp. NPDC055105 TaxID=3365719 RepID=UPI0037D05BF4
MTAQPAKPTAATPGRRASSLAAVVWRGTRQFRPVLLLLLALVVLLLLTQQAFGTSSNLQNLLAGVSVLWIVSLGMTFALLAAGADLSVGAFATLSGVALARLMQHGLPGYVAIPVVVLAAAVLGAAVNGALIGYGRLSFFVVTLASMTTLTGIVNLWTGGDSTFVTDHTVTAIGAYAFAGLGIPVWIVIISLVLALWLQRQTYFGRDVYAVGGSLTASRLSGIRSGRTLALVYALCAACAAVGGTIAAGRVGVAVPNVDGSLALQSIAAVLLGGTSLMGGVGGVGGTALGVLFIGTLQNGLSLAGLPSFWQQVVTGIILVIAVLGDRVVHRRGGARATAPPTPPAGPDGTAMSAAGIHRSTPGPPSLTTD